MKRVLLFLVILVSPWFLKANIRADEKPFLVVLDAGHGGKDPGCIGYSGVKEKNVALSVVLKVGKLIEQNCPNVKVIYTRNTDVFVELYQRAKIANRNKADLFISIHCNAVDKNTSANGIETYIMGTARNDENLQMAMRENAAILQEEDHVSVYDGFDPKSAEAYIIFSLFQNVYQSQSLYFADLVQKTLVKNTKRHDRSVRQAPYLVLRHATMPSALIEIGFLSSKEEEAYLASEVGQNTVSQSIFMAFYEYKNYITGSNDPLPQITFPAPETKDTVKSVVTTPSEASSDTDIRFRVQFYSSPDKLEITDSKFNAVPDVRRYFYNGAWRFTSGNAQRWEKITNLLQQVKAAGFSDAFIVSFEGENRISNSVAREKLKSIQQK